MRFVCSVLFSISCCIGCTKVNNNNNNKNAQAVFQDPKLVISESGAPDTSVINYKNCLQTDYKADHIQVCLDSVIEDSRCPRAVECVWAGTAIVKFSVTVNDQQRPVTLSTLKLPAIAPSDTILLGYKVEFLDLLPYPEVNSSHDFSDYRAELKITKQ